MFALVVAKPRLLLGSDQHLTGLPGGLDYRSTAFEALLGRHPLTRETSALQFVVVTTSVEHHVVKDVAHNL
jgi:hypothetical protein